MTTINRRRFIQGAVAAPSVVTASHALAQADRRPALVVAVAALPATLEPARELSNVGTRVTYSIFDTLIRRDFLSSADGGGSALKPHLATAWERKSPQELVVTLRPGVKFHNGDQVTAEDVAYTFREGRLWGEKTEIPDGRAYFGVLAGVDVMDKHTVRFRTRVPDVLLEHRLASWCAWIVSRRAYEERGMEGFSRNPVGSGPFRFVSMSANDQIVLDAFDEYWMGRPAARRVTFKAVPELAARVAGLVSGDYGLITNVPPDQISVIDGYSGVETRSVVLANSHLLTFDERGAAMGDKRVRQALALSIDRQKLVESLWLGKAIVPPGHNYPEYGQMFLEGRSLPFAPDRAKALLREAGYKGQLITYRTMPNYYERPRCRADHRRDVEGGRHQRSSPGGREFRPDASRGPAGRQQFELHPAARPARLALGVMGTEQRVSALQSLHGHGRLQRGRPGARGRDGPGQAPPALRPHAGRVGGRLPGHGPLSAARNVRRQQARELEALLLLLHGSAAR